MCQLDFGNELKYWESLNFIFCRLLTKVRVINLSRISNFSEQRNFSNSQNVLWKRLSLQNNQTELWQNLDQINCKRNRLEKLKIRRNLCSQVFLVGLSAVRGLPRSIQAAANTNKPEGQIGTHRKPKKINYEEQVVLRSNQLCARHIVGGLVGGWGIFTLHPYHGSQRGSTGL